MNTTLQIVGYHVLTITQVLGQQFPNPETVTAAARSWETRIFVWLGVLVTVGGIVTKANLPESVTSSVRRTA